MTRWMNAALAIATVGMMLIANLAGWASATSGIGLSPPERRVRISGEGNATAMFLLFNPADAEQQFAVLLPDDTNVTVEPAEGKIGPGEHLQLLFTVWSEGNVTFEPRIVMRPAGQGDQMLQTGITARIKVDESAEPVTNSRGRSLLSGMAIAYGQGKSAAGAFLAACALPALFGLRWLRRKRSKKNGKRNKDGSTC